MRAFGTRLLGLSFWLLFACGDAKNGSGEVSGWSVLVKTDDASKSGGGYYWLETVSTRAGRAADYEGQGIGVCVGCHSAGRDYFRTPWPL
jgi:hypothetical protein